jgi:hypothetical protein
MNRKRFCPHDAVYGREAELAALQWLARCGVTASGPGRRNDPYGPDVAIDAMGPVRFLEIERRRRGWSAGKFPWPTVNIPARRLEKPTTPESAFVVVRADLEMAFWIGPDVLQRVPEIGRPIRLPEIDDSGWSIPVENVAGYLDFSRGTVCPFGGVF